MLFDDQKVRPLGGWEDVKKECLKSFYQPVLLLYELEDSKESKYYNSENGSNNNDDNSKNNCNNCNNSTSNNNKAKRDNSDDNSKNNNDDNNNNYDYLYSNQYTYEQDRLDEKILFTKRLEEIKEIKCKMENENVHNDLELKNSLSPIQNSSFNFSSSFIYPTISLEDTFHLFFDSTKSIEKISTECITEHSLNNDTIHGDTGCPPSNVKMSEGGEGLDTTGSAHAYSGQLLPIIIYELRPLIFSVTLPLTDPIVPVPIPVPVPGPILGSAVPKGSSPRNTFFSSHPGLKNDTSGSLQNLKNTTHALPQNQIEGQPQSQSEGHQKLIDILRKNQKRSLGIIYDINERGHIVIVNFVRHPHTGIIRINNF